MAMIAVHAATTNVARDTEVDLLAKTDCEGIVVYIDRTWDTLISVSVTVVNTTHVKVKGKAFAYESTYSWVPVSLETVIECPWRQTFVLISTGLVAKANLVVNKEYIAKVVSNTQEWCYTPVIVNLSVPYACKCVITCNSSTCNWCSALIESAFKA